MYVSFLMGLQVTYNWQQVCADQDRWQCQYQAHKFLFSTNDISRSLID